MQRTRLTKGMYVLCVRGAGGDYDRRCLCTEHREEPQVQTYVVLAGCRQTGRKRTLTHVIAPTSRALSSANWERL